MADKDFMLKYVNGNLTRYDMATLHLMVGLPGSGKNTEAKKLEQKYGALRLTPDEWQYFLFGHDISDPEHDERHTRVEELMWEIAVKVLKAGGMSSLISDSGQNQNVTNSEEKPIPLERLPKSTIWMCLRTLFGNGYLRAINWPERTLFFM